MDTFPSMAFAIFNTFLITFWALWSRKESREDMRDLDRKINDLNNLAMKMQIEYQRKEMK
jgi:hypothetical protein